MLLLLIVRSFHPQERRQIETKNGSRQVANPKTSVSLSHTTKPKKNLNPFGIGVLCNTHTHTDKTQRHTHLEDKMEEDSAVQDFLDILEEHRKNCENEGKYVEAEIAKNRLEELKLHEENRRVEALRSRQIAERLGVEEAHMLEFQQFNQKWDKKMEIRAEATLLENAKARHAQELREFQAKLLASPLKPKFSKELLNLKRFNNTSRNKETTPRLTR